MKTQTLAYELLEENKTFYSQYSEDERFKNLNRSDKASVQRILNNLIRQEYY